MLKLRRQVGFDFLHHGLKCRFVADGIQTRIAFDVKPPGCTPTLIDGLPECGEGRSGFALLSIDGDIRDPVSLSQPSEPGNRW